MEKRAMLAFILSLIVLLAYQYLFFPKGQKQNPVPQMEEVQKKDPGKKSIEEPETKEKIPSLRENIPWKGEEEIVSVETDLAIYRISTRDAVIKEIVLKKYKDDKGEPVRLVPDDTALYPLQIISEEEGGLNFTPSRKEIKVGDQKENLVMSFVEPNGKRIEKIFEFKRDSYGIHIQITQNLLKKYHLLAGSYLIKPKEKADSGTAHAGPVIDLQGEIKRVSSKEIKESKTFSGNIPWIALEEKYFMTALLPEKTDTVAILERLEKKEGPNVFLGLLGDDEDLSFVFFAGPKDYELLKSFGRDLEKVINFGMFGVLAKPIFYILKGTYRYVRNYGLAIILLTTFIKIIFWPLTQKQQKSMQQMQKIQPEINVIRERHKNDQQRITTETMALYKKYKVNPAAGCLPLLIQIPVFFALYNVLLNAIELRGSPFLYIKDLSAADTLFGHVYGFSIGPLPLLMGVSMYIQQKMMPTTMDPKQAKIFQFMPLIFTFMFLNFPSGLVLYWLVNNILTIVQQYFINKRKLVS